MELDSINTVLAYAVVIVLGTGSLFVLPEITPMAAMTPGTILMMVVPSMAIFGAIMLAIGVSHGQYRATN